LPHNTPIVTKHQPNAFQGTGFHSYLQQHHPDVNRLLLMGWHTEACVASTAGTWDFFADLDPGATHLGYTVMSCDDVLHGGPATWADNSGQACRQRIEFYATL
jgi:nicotinamidase-related amidase